MASRRLFRNGSLPSTPMVIGVLASGNALVGHSTNKANLHKKAAFKSYSCATCPRAARPVKLTKQINTAFRNAMSPLRIRRVESRGAKLENQIQDAGDPKDSGRLRTTPDY